MRIPQLVAGALVARQAVQLLPSTFCSPECPSCRIDVGNFDGATTSCVANSSFIQNCGLCQSCVMTYAIENGGIDTQSQIETILVNILNLCENTTVSADIAALQSQASRMSVLGAELATTTDPALASMTGSITITSPPTPNPTAAGSNTGTPAWMTMTGDDENTSWQSILATATWASYYYAHKSAESASLASISAALAAKQTSTTSSSTAKPTQSSAPVPLSPTWIAGPVVGSVMGMCTVFTVIFFTRRKQQKEEIKEIIKVVEVEKAKEYHDNDSAHSPDQPVKVQLQPEILPPPVEMDVHEIHELAAVEPVGSELNTPMEARMREDDWPISPMPLSPLPLLFAMTEMRDHRNGVVDVSPRHDTFYHP